MPASHIILLDTFIFKITLIKFAVVSFLQNINGLKTTRFFFYRSSFPSSNFNLSREIFHSTIRIVSLIRDRLAVYC